MIYMDLFTDFIKEIDNIGYREKMNKMLFWISRELPSLEPAIKWKQPMFTHHGTYIIGFSVSKKHIAVVPEQDALNHFNEDIKKAEYTSTQNLFRIKWNQVVDYSLLKNIIEYNISQKTNCNSFWRRVE